MITPSPCPMMESQAYLSSWIRLRVARPPLVLDSRQGDAGVASQLRGLSSRAQDRPNLLYCLRLCAENAECSADLGFRGRKMMNFLQMWDTGVEICCTVCNFALKMLNVLGISDLHVQK